MPAIRRLDECDAETVRKNVARSRKALCRPIILQLRRAAVTLAFLPGPLGAQQSPDKAANSSARLPAVVRVQVIDSAGKAIVGADVTIVHGLSEALARGVADKNGLSVLPIPSRAGEIEVIARHIGYQRVDRFVSVIENDTATVMLRMDPAVQSLAPVSVTAEEDLKRKSYYADADQIARSTRLIVNGMNVLTKMRPDILRGRAPGCGVRNVYVNGERIVNPPPNEMALAHMPPEPPAGVRESESFLRPLDDPLNAPRAQQDVWTIMWNIKAEHIEQMLYKDCFDTSMPGTHGSSALYVILKPGIAYDPGRGSYVADSAPRPKSRPGSATRPAGATTPITLVLSRRQTTITHTQMGAPSRPASIGFASDRTSRGSRSISVRADPARCDPGAEHACGSIVIWTL